LSAGNTEYQSCHDEIVGILFEELCKKGYQNIRASLIGLSKEIRPEEIYCARAKMIFCPDLSAEKEGYTFIFEVVTPDSIDLVLTQMELETFSAHANKCGAYLYIVVPEEIREKTKKILFEIEEWNSHKAFVLTV
jgi:Holliday junction resolvase